MKKSNFVGITDSSNFSAQNFSSNRNFSQNFKCRQELINKYILNNIVTTSENTSNDKIRKLPTPINNLTPHQVFMQNS